MLPRVEYSVTVPVSVDAAFAAFQNLERLLGRGVYHEASWVEGTPWQVGSRLRFVVERPIQATVSAVVLSVSAPRTLTLLHHALGITAEEHLTVGPDLQGGSRIDVVFEFLGSSPEFSEEAVHAALDFLAKDALDTVVLLCPQRRARSAPG